MEGRTRASRGEERVEMRGEGGKCTAAGKNYAAGDAEKESRGRAQRFTIG